MLRAPQPLPPARRYSHTAGDSEQAHPESEAQSVAPGLQVKFLLETPPPVNSPVFFPTSPSHSELPLP